MRSGYHGPPRLSGLDYLGLKFQPFGVNRLEAGEPNRNRTALTSRPTWFGEFIKRAHKSVSSRTEFDSVRGTAKSARRCRTSSVSAMAVLPIGNEES